MSTGFFFLTDLSDIIPGLLEMWVFYFLKCKSFPTKTTSYFFPFPTANLPCSITSKRKKWKRSMRRQKDLNFQNQKSLNSL